MLFQVEIVHCAPDAAVRTIDDSFEEFPFTVDFDPAPDVEDQEAKERRSAEIRQRVAERRQAANPRNALFFNSIKGGTHSASDSFVTKNSSSDT